MTTTAQASATAPGSTAHTDGGWDLVPVQTRSERPRSYEPSAFGAPTGREVNWKHSPIAAVAPLFADEPGDEGAVGITVTGPLAALVVLQDHFRVPAHHDQDAFGVRHQDGGRR